MILLGVRILIFDDPAEQAGSSVASRRIKKCKVATNPPQEIAI
jgi:hypothetical protein